MKIPAVNVRCFAILNEVYAEPKIGVEIGVYRGDLSWRLLNANRGIFLHLVDPWREMSGSYQTTDDKIARFDQAQHDEVMRMALDAVKPFKGRYKVHRMTSEEAANGFADESVDFVFIDGDHSYEGCSTDIRCWWPKLKPGGLLSGHDYRDEFGFGVIRAVQEFKGTRELRLSHNHTWFITK